MATCKDCLHYEACASMLESMGYTVDGDGIDADKRCDTFASKAALDVLVAHAVCASSGLYCGLDCPFSEKENRCDNWNETKLIEAVHHLNGRKNSEK